MMAILQMIFWNAFSWKKMCELLRIFLLNFVPKGTNNNIPDNGFGSTRQQAIIWTKDG